MPRRNKNALKKRSYARHPKHKHRNRPKPDKKRKPLPFIPSRIRNGRS